MYGLDDWKLLGVTPFCGMKSMLYVISRILHTTLFF